MSLSQLDVMWHHGFYNHEGHVLLLASRKAGEYDGTWTVYVECCREVGVAGVAVLPL